MNTSFKKLLTAALIIVGATAYADSSDTNKTFLMPRSHGVNLAMKYASWHDTLHNKGDDRFGGNVQLSWFYSASTNDADLGKYFGIRSQNRVGLRRGEPNQFASNVKNHLDLGYLIHGFDIPPAAPATDAPTEVMVQMKPEQTSYGFVLDYHQNLEKLLDGLYFSISIPIVYVKNDMNMRVFSCGAAHKTAAENVLKYFRGEYEVTEGSNKQEKLKNALMGCMNDSQTGVADIPLILGYDFINDECYHAGINIGLIIPTGNEAEGCRLFEAIVGNGGHFAFGAGLDGSVKLWGEDNHTFTLVGAVDYRYLFENCEKRTLSPVGPCENECTKANCTDCVAIACPKKDTCPKTCTKSFDAKRLVSVSTDTASLDAE